MPFQKIEPGSPITSLSTPIVVIDEGIMAQNIARVQPYMDKIGLAFRPHIKTHKIPAIARSQIEAGAIGINCQKVSEAEIFADAGFDDILISFNIMGAEKLKHLVKLNQRVNLKVTADSAFTVKGLAKAFDPDHPLVVLVECDTGGQRCGVQTPPAALELAQLIHTLEGVEFGGLMTYPAPQDEQNAEHFLCTTLALLDAEGIGCPCVSYGGSPSLFNAHLVPSATEYRAGTYLYNDRSLVRAGHCKQSDCAMQILTTIVARPTHDRAIVDAGSKALTSDLLGFEDYGLIVEHPDARIILLSEEHGTIDLSNCTGKRPEIGDVVRIIPNHTCVVSNLFDQMVFHRDGHVTKKADVAARGLVW